MKRRFVGAICFCIAAACLYAQNMAADTDEILPIRIGIFGHRQYPLTKYGDHVYFEEGLGLMGEYTLPVTLFDRPFGVAAHLFGGKILSGNTSLDHGYFFSLYGSAWLSLPLKHDISFRPELAVGFASRSEAIKDVEETYTDALFQIAGSFRWEPYALFDGDLAFDIAPYVSLVPFEDNTTAFFGIRLGLVYNLGKTIHTMQVRRAERGVQELRDSLEKLRISDVMVLRKSDGLTLVMDNIQFAPNSADLVDGEKKKLDALQPLLEQYTNNLLIAGYCADDGSSENNMHISAARAGAVADYLISKGVRDENDVVVVGRGSLDAGDGSRTDAARAKNRRVEITLLEN